MAKIGIISDTHDNFLMIDQAIKVFTNEKINYLFHCGDIISPFSTKKFFDLKIPQFFVFGNNDGEKKVNRKFIAENPFAEINEIVLMKDIDGCSIAMTHGHHEDVLDLLLSCGKFNYVFSGHIHQKINKKLPNGTIHINPGEGGGHLTNEATVVILDTETSQIDFLTL